MAYDAVVATQNFEEQAINVASDLPTIDVSRDFTSGLSSVIEPGTVLKKSGHRKGLNTAVVAGANAGGGAQTIAVADIVTEDELRSVLRFVGGGTDVTDVEDVTAKFTISSDGNIEQADTDMSSDKLVVIWSSAAHFTNTYEPWIQGTDELRDIEGVYVGPQDLDTDNQTVGLVRRFGAVRESQLVAWTSADGSTQADINDDALVSLSELNVLPM